MLSLLSQLAQYDSSYTTPSITSDQVANVTAVLLPLMLFGLALLVLIMVSMWKIFTKAGKPGWAAIVPIYNVVVELEIVGRPTWWVLFFLLGFVPVVGSIATLGFAIVITNDLSKSFGKGIGFTLLLIFLPFIGFPMLAFGKSQYHGLAAGVTPATSPSMAPPAAPTPPTPPTISTPQA
jgi:uncharacterized protein DUF5684